MLFLYTKQGGIPKNYQSGAERNRENKLSSFVCRIPRNAVNFIALSPGDIIVRGEIADEIEDVSGKRNSDLLNKYRDAAFTVKAVSDNTQFPFIPHIRASGV